MSLNGRISRLEKMIPAQETAVLAGRALPPMAVLMPAIEAAAVAMLEAPQADDPGIDPVLNFREATAAAECSTADVWRLFAKNGPEQFSELESISLWMFVGLLCWRPADWQGWLEKWPSYLWFQKRFFVYEPALRVKAAAGNMWNL